MTKRSGSETSNLKSGVSAAKRRVDAVKTGTIEQELPCLLAVLADDDLLQQVKDDALHLDRVSARESCGMS